MEKAKEQRKKKGSDKREDDGRKEEEEEEEKKVEKKDEEKDDEDSQDVQVDASNIFEANRFPGKDGIEEIAGAPDDEYFKREVTLEVDGRTVDCLVYEINPARLSGAPRIACGDWMAEMGRASQG